MKVWILFIAFLAASPVLQAQTTRGSDSEYAQSDALQAKNLINERPRYGGLSKSAEQLDADNRFVAETLRNYGSAQSAMQGLG